MSYLEFKDWRANSADLDEVAHYEPPNQDICCFQIQLFSSLVKKDQDTGKQQDLALCETIYFESSITLQI